MFIDSIMFKNVSVIMATAETPLSEAATRLHKNKFSLLVVCSEDGQVTGVLSEKDIVRGVSESIEALPEMTIEDLMTSAPMTCSIDSIPGDVMDAMNKGGFRHMPVVDNDTLVGLVTMTDIHKYLLMT